MKYLILTLCSILIIASTASANLISNGDFEAVSISSNSYKLYAEYDGWMLPQSHIEIQRGYPFSGSNTSAYVEMDGLYNYSLEQSLNLVSGKTYDFSFDYLNRMKTSGSGGKLVSSGGVEIGLGSFYTFAPDINTSEWTTFQDSFLYSGPTGAVTLSILGTGASDKFGGFVDNFVLTESSVAPSPVPLPGTAVLLGGGLLGLIGVRRRSVF